MKLSINNQNETKNAASKQQVSNPSSEPVMHEVDVIGLMTSLKSNGRAKLSEHFKDAEVVEPIAEIPADATVSEAAGEIVPAPKAKKPVTLKRKTTIKEKASNAGSSKAKAAPLKKSEADALLPPVGFTTYKTKKGKDAPMIVGFSGENDPRWRPIYDDRPKWVSASFRTKPDGTKECYMLFGTRYMDAAKRLVHAYNQSDKMEWHKAEDACVKVYEQAVADGKQRWEEKKQHWAEAKAEKQAAKAADGKAAVAQQPTQQAKTYTEADVAAMLRDVLAGKELPKDVARLMEKAA